MSYSANLSTQVIAKMIEQIKCFEKIQIGIIYSAYYHKILKLRNDVYFFWYEVTKAISQLYAD